MCIITFIFKNFPVTYANSFYKKLKGLMFSKNESKGIMLNKCKSIHTFGMKYNIDLIFIDKNGHYLSKRLSVTPNKIIFGPKNTYSIIEIPSSKNLCKIIPLKIIKEIS